MSYSINWILINSDVPDFNPIVNYVSAYTLSVVGAISAILGVISVVFIFKLGFKIVRSSDDPEERQQALHAIVWWAIGLCLCAAASPISIAFANILFTKVK